MTKKNQGKLVRNPKRTGFVEARFASRLQGNFQLGEPKIKNWIRICESLYWSLGPVTKIFAVVPFLGGFQKKDYHALLTRRLEKSKSGERGGR